MHSISIAVKPLHSFVDFAYVEMNTWEIDGDMPKNFDSLWIGFGQVNGSFVPIEFEPREYFEYALWPHFQTRSGNMLTLA